MQEILSLSGGRTKRTGELGAVDVEVMKESPLYRMEVTKLMHLLKKQIQRCFCVICEGPGPGLWTQEHVFSRFLFVSGNFKGKKHSSTTQTRGFQKLHVGPSVLHIQANLLCVILSSAYRMPLPNTHFICLLVLASYAILMMNFFATIR